jgi:methylmalonyl-CoA mutase, C-terminal domain
LGKRLKILVAKPGLDGHDRGAKVIAQTLRDAGMEVVYTGLHKTVDHIVHMAIQEDADVVGLSILSGAHIPICEKLLQKMAEAGLTNTVVTVGGVIPNQDIPRLRELGVKGIFPGGTKLSEIVEFMQTKVKKDRGEL